jgi:tRNA-dihydrouridine synthase B
MLCAEKGEKIGMCEARKHLAWFTKGMRFSSGARGMINTLSSLDDARRIIDFLLNTGDNNI